MIAERLGCAEDQLADRGVNIQSAGLSAMMGGRAAAEAIQTVGKCGLNLADHESQPLTQQLVRQADIIWTMTGAHRSAIVSQWPEAAARASLLAPNGLDIPDPIGGPLELYGQCAQRIKNELAARVAQLEL
jgi:protein-tyrosine phosphatase